MAKCWFIVSWESRDQVSFRSIYLINILSNLYIATIVIAYLMSRYNYSLNTAYSLVKSRRPEINPNPLFMRILQQYEQELAVKDQQRQQNSVDFNRYVKATPHAAVDHRPISTYYPSHDPYGQYTSRSFYG